MEIGVPVRPMRLDKGGSSCFCLAKVSSTGDGWKEHRAEIVRVFGQLWGSLLGGECARMNGGSLMISFLCRRRDRTVLISECLSILDNLAKT